MGGKPKLLGVQNRGHVADPCCNRSRDPRRINRRRKGGGGGKEDFVRSHLCHLFRDRQDRSCGFKIRRVGDAIKDFLAPGLGIDWEENGPPNQSLGLHIRRSGIKVASPTLSGRAKPKKEKSRKNGDFMVDEEEKIKKRKN